MLRRWGAGPAPEYGADYFGAFLLDPDGNSAEAMHHDGVRLDGNVDHLWIRVAEVAASKRFYETIAPHAGLRLRSNTAERAQLSVAGGSFSVLAGTPTEQLRMAFGTEDDVDALHRAAVGAGYHDNGAPGERAATTRATTRHSCSIPTETASSS